MSHDFAALLLARHPRFGDFTDTDQANAQAELLRVNGLDALNVNVLQSPLAEVLDVIAEHNTAAMLLRLGFTDLRYEPPSMPRPVDFVGTRGGRCYRIEVKRLGASQHDDLQSTVMETLNRALESNTERVAIDMHLQESFEAADLNELVRHVKRALRDPSPGQRHTFAPDEEVAASYEFHPSARAEHPYVAALGDFGFELRDVTGVEASRVVGKVRRAYAKFKACADDGAVHLVALVVYNTTHLSDVAEALYGREHSKWTRHGYAGLGREPGGAFSPGSGRHSRLGGLIVARSTTRFRLFCAYAFTLFVNPGGGLPVAEVAEALGANRVLGPDDFS